MKTHITVSVKSVHFGVGWFPGEAPLLFQLILFEWLGDLITIFDFGIGQFRIMLAIDLEDIQ